VWNTIAYTNSHCYCYCYCYCNGYSYRNSDSHRDADLRAACGSERTNRNQYNF